MTIEQLGVSRGRAKANTAQAVAIKANAVVT
jgi:hypothetical protein